MLIRRDIRSFQDVNYNFQLIERMLRGHGLDGDQIREIPSDLITGLGDLAFDDAVEAAKLGETIIEGGYIKTGLVHASRIDVGALNADRIAARSITTDKITIGGVTTENLQDLLVTSAKLAFQAVISDKISTNAVHASHVIAGAITTPKLAAGAVQADKIQAGAIETYHITATGISADVITTGALNANLITVGYMSADRINTGTIDASQINVTNINANNITAGTMVADRIFGGTLSGVQIYVSTNAYVGDTLYLGLTSNSSGKTIRFSNAATISNMPVAEDIRISARAINLGGNVFSSGYIYFDTSKGVHLPTRNAGSGSRTTNEFTMPYWTGNMCYIDLGNDRIAVRDRWGILKGYISFDD